MSVALTVAATVHAIDNHTHLLDPGAFKPDMDARLPLGQRSTAPGTRRALVARFGVSGEGSLPAAAVCAGTRSGCTDGRLLDPRPATGVTSPPMVHRGA